MAYPSVTSITQAAYLNTTTPDVEMPAAVNAGELLIMILATELVDVTVGPSGWTVLDSPVTGFATYAKVADGTEGGTTVEVTVSTLQRSVSQVYRITDWYGAITDGVEAGSAVTATTDSPNPPSLTASWGSAENLWIAAAGGANDAATFDAAPANYTDLTQLASGGSINESCEVGSARRENTTATEDPGTFTLSETEATGANTIVVRAVAAGGNAPTADLQGPLWGPLGGPLMYRFF